MLYSIASVEPHDIAPAHDPVSRLLRVPVNPTHGVAALVCAGSPVDDGVGLCLPDFRGSMHRSPRRECRVINYPQDKLLI